MKWKALTILLIAVALPMGSATAQSRDDNWARCKADDLDLRISGCTALIESGRETPQDLALAFLNRGNAYDDKGQLDRALQDYDQAIKFNPNLAFAFYLRGLAKLKRGDKAGGDADIAKVKQLDPKVDQ